ncbi:DUF6233 domain-containing protein [Streptomyces sp. NPDC126503]|uniref:DUF6233 domain-containing protein n=1 Tax=Streptomyces sp. NPDC126503 TaxID=3155315 RepID=UPI003320000B
MLDLPDDLSRLRTLERLAQIILRDIQLKISEVTRRDAELRARRPLRERPAWLLSYRREAGRPVPDSIHAGDCPLAGHHTRPVTRDEARHALAEGHVTACEVCRADTELGLLG